MRKKFIVIVIFMLIITLLLSYKSSNFNNHFDKDKFLAVVVNGRNQNYFPAKDNYEVNIFCNNTKAKWDYRNWKMIINNINNNTKCAIHFKTSALTSLAEHVKSLEDTEQGTGKLVREISVDFEEADIKDITYYSNIVNDATYPYTWNEDYYWSSTNHDHSSTSTFSFKPSENGPVSLCFYISSEKWYDWATIYVDDIEVGYKTGSYIYCQYLGNLNTDNTVKITYKKDEDTSTGDDRFSFYIVANDILETYGDYRYEGKNPNNWIIFNNEYWRIIGVFGENTHNLEGQELVKVIREDKLGTYTFDKDNSNNWATSSLNTLLNDNYYNGLDESELTNCYGHTYYGIVSSVCNFTRDGIIHENSRNMVETVSWKLGGLVTPYATAQECYDAERDGPAISGKIGLMYLSDYGYSALAESCNRYWDIGQYDHNECAGSSWLYGKGEEWTLTKYKNNSSNVFFITNYGITTTYYASLSYGVRPTLYLKSGVKKLAGNGSFDNPYIITQ